MLLLQPSANERIVGRNDRCNSASVAASAAIKVFDVIETAPRRKVPRGGPRRAALIPMRQHRALPTARVC